jgi:DNA-binding SARP family transcriptional activator/tetratricopeptide (TPR) repeat protein
LFHRCSDISLLLWLQHTVGGVDRALISRWTRSNDPPILKAVLQITLLGPPQIILDGQPLLLRPRNSGRAKALLYYLAASGRAETRERLAGLLWSDWPEKKAREYLRGELFLLNPLKPLHLVEVDGRLALNPETCTIDLARFCELTERVDATVEELDAAVRLWSGDFLEGLESAVEAGAVLLLEWLQTQRSGWERARRETLYRLAEAATRTGQRLDLGTAACTELLKEEPEREEVHRLKMRLLALAGQRTAALKQYDACTTALLDELGVPPSAETNALYDQIVVGDVGPQGPALAAAAAAPFQAPAASGHFVGRAAERAWITTWLAAPDRSGIIAIVGMGGSGKTALATEIAHQLRKEFPDGVLWAHAGDDEPLDILQSWALAYDKDLSKIGSAEARAAAMRNILATRRALIVLDSVIGGRAIDLLLPGAAACPVLITTRDRTEVAARTTEIVELPEFSTEESLALLRHFLGEGGVAAEQEAATALCTTLGGLPLAVEIAAQRVFASPRRSLARMVRSLQAAGDRLAHGISHRSVRTSFTVSWEALTPALQRTFALSGLFDGRPFSPAAVAAAASARSATLAGAVLCEEELDAVGEQLDQLVTLSMLRIDRQDRFVHHRLLADFAAEKLAELPDLDAICLRYAAYCRTFAQQTAGDFDVLEAEWDNLLAGVAMAHQRQAWELVIGCVDALTAPWFARARFGHARQGYRWALEAAVAVGDETRRAGYAYFLAKAHLRQDDYGTARELLDSAIAVFRAREDQPRRADAYVDLADVAFEQGQFNEAMDGLEAAEAIYRQLGQGVGVATVKSRQALITCLEGDDDAARLLCEEGLACLPPGDGAIVRSRTLRLLTDLALRSSQLDEAAEYCQRAQAANQTVNDPTESAAILFAQAKLDHFMGDHRAALTNARRSVELYRTMGDRKGTAIVNHFVGRLYLACHEPHAAHTAAEYGLSLSRALGDDDLIGLYAEQLAAIAQAMVH